MELDLTPGPVSGASLPLHLPLSLSFCLSPRETPAADPAVEALRASVNKLTHEQELECSRPTTVLRRD